MFRLWGLFGTTGIETRPLRKLSNGLVIINVKVILKKYRGNWVLDKGTHSKWRGVVRMSGNSELSKTKRADDKHM